METTLETSDYKLTGLPTFMIWFKQSISPFLVRWWVWIALIVSIGYLTYFFNQISLERRIIEIESNAQKLDQGANKEEGRRERISYKAGLYAGRVVRSVLDHSAACLAVIVLIVALLKIHYQYIFRRLFERSTWSRGVYLGLIVICWLTLALLLSIAIGKKGAQQNYQWTVANGFVLLNVGYSLFRSWLDGRRRQLALIQQRTQAELNALKAQVNPHFLFNSLNNIYGTAILEDSPRTAESIQQLSGIVRYVMEESRLQTTDIQRELRFIDDFVELQRIRLPNQDNIDIKTDIEWDEKPAQIVPLLLNPLIENAFKYGISIQYPCLVQIHLQVQNGTLHLTTKNSILPRTDLQKGSGLGLANVRQRLALAYPERHTLRVEEVNNTFQVDLTIKL